MQNERSVVITQGKNGILSATADGIRLNSAYNPQKEAENFVSGIQCAFEPSLVVITEPALSYAAPYLRTRFKNARLCAIRYTTSFREYDLLFDTVLYLSSNSSLSESLFSAFGEETLSKTLFTSWEPSKKAFPDKDSEAWSEIKKAVLKSRDVLATRTYFSLRWTKNAVRFCTLVKNTLTITPTPSPVIICASGPSLMSSLDAISQNRDRAILFAVSSAVSALLKKGITPDVIISTDGGYWAKPHLWECQKKLKSVPVALSPEAACYASVLQEQKIIALSYGDGISEDILKECSIKTQKAERNGTVSGTALSLALSISSGPVFLCGLDLSGAKGKVHAEPNQNEMRDSIKDCFFSPKETRLCPTQFYSPSLAVYQSWFKSRDFKNRVYRLSDNYPYKNSLGTIKDVNWSFFASLCKEKIPPLKFTQNQITSSTEERKKTVAGVLEKNRQNPLWIKDALPALCVLKERALNAEEKQKQKKALQDGMEKFILEAKKALGDFYDL